MRGTGLFVVFDVALIFAGLAAFAAPAWRSPRLATAVAALCTATPQLVLYPGIVWKDVLFAGAFVAGFACLLHAARRWGRGRLRWALVAAALGLLSLAGLARQNGVVALVFGAVALGWIAAPADAGARRRVVAGLAHGAVFLAGGVVIMAAATLALATRGDGEPSRAFQWEDLQTYDIVAALALRPGLPLPELERRNPALARYLRTTGVAAYSPVRVDALEELAPLRDRRAAHLAAIGAQWKDLVLRHPLLYLRLRARAFAWVVLTPRIRECLPIYVGIDGPDPEFTDLGLHHRSDGRERALTAYVQPFVGTPVLLHLPYGLLGLLLFAGLVRRRGEGDMVVAAMLGAAGAFGLSYVLISIACDYRYLYALDLAVMAAALYAAATTPLKALQRLSRTSPSAPTAIRQTAKGQ